MLARVFRWGFVINRGRASPPFSERLAAFETHSRDSYNSQYETGSAFSYGLRPDGRGTRRISRVSATCVVPVQRSVTLLSTVTAAFCLSALLPLNTRNDELPVPKNQEQALGSVCPVAL